jgi:endoglucanase
MKRTELLVVWVLLIVSCLIFTSCQADVQNHSFALDEPLAPTQNSALTLPIQLTPTATGLTAVQAIQLMQRGINMGNTLEVPDDEDWGFELTPGYFEQIWAAGFQSVRLPVQWSAHLSDPAACIISAEFFNRVDRAVDWALTENLVVVLDVHHFDLNQDTLEKSQSCLYAIWSQISDHYQTYPDTLLFELLNEPQAQLSTQAWNEMIARITGLIREKNPARILIVGGKNWNAYDQLSALSLPSDDPYLMGTFHYYLPFEFTHQGASWVTGSEANVGRKWLGNITERDLIMNHFNQVATWAKQTGIPVYLGEFGSYEKADLASRIRWTAFIREQAESRNFAWAYWEFGAGFGIFDLETQQWRGDLLQALIP